MFHLSTSCSGGLLLLLAIGGLRAQVAAPAAPAAAEAIPPPPERTGLQLRNVTAYTVYYSAILPGGAQSAVSLPGDVGAGGSFEVGWNKATERSTASLVYTPSYTGRVRYRSWNALNHGLTLAATRKLAPRWRLGFNLSGAYSNLEQFLFSSTAVSNLAAAPSTFNELTSALLNGAANTPALASAMAGSPAEGSPLRVLLFGERMLTAVGRVALTYSSSPRMSLSVQGTVARSQHIGDSSLGPQQQQYLLFGTTSEEGSGTLTYSLSPVTRVGAEVSVRRSVTIVQQGHRTVIVQISQATYGRTLGRRWLLRLHGGAGLLRGDRDSNISSAPLPTGGASLAFKTGSHTFIGSAERTVSDAYSPGTAATNQVDGTWHWGRPGRKWWLQSAASYQQQRLPQGLGGMSGERITAGFGRMLPARLALMTEYAYLHFAARTAGISISQSAVRLSLQWAPGPNVF